MSSRRRTVGLLTVTALTALAGLMPTAWAQPKPIRLVVPYPPGGPLDIVARALAERVKDSLGTVVVENVPVPVATWARTWWPSRRLTAPPS